MERPPALDAGSIESGSKIHKPPLPNPTFDIKRRLFDSFYSGVDSFCIKLAPKSIKRDSFCTNVDSFFLTLESFCSSFEPKSISVASFFLNVEPFCSDVDSFCISLDSFYTNVASFSINVDTLKWRGVLPKWGTPPPMYP